MLRLSWSLLLMVGCGIAFADDVGRASLNRNLPSEAPNFGRLPPLQLEAIQGVGRSVLAAGHGAAQDPDANAIHQEVKALGIEIDQVITAITQGAPVLLDDQGRAVTTGDGGRSGVQRGLSARSGGADFAAVRARLSAISQVTERSRSSVQAGLGNPLIAGLAAKSGALQDEVRNALAATSPGDLGKLGRLRDRLKPKSLAEIMLERRAADRAAGIAVPEPTPTLSTLIRHR